MGGTQEWGHAGGAACVPDESHHHHVLHVGPGPVCSIGLPAAG